MLGYEENERPNYFNLMELVNKSPRVVVNFENWYLSLIKSNCDYYCKKFAAMDIRE